MPAWKQNLRNDATVVSNIHELQKPLKYLYAVKKRLDECIKVNGNAEVYIGIAGKSNPSFKVLYQDSEGPHNRFGKYIDTGTPFTNPDQPDSSLWSNRSTTLAEVNALIDLLEK